MISCICHGEKFGRTVALSAIGERVAALQFGATAPLNSEHSLPVAIPTPILPTLDGSTVDQFLRNVDVLFS